MPRRQITAPADDDLPYDAGDLPDLTEQQMGYVQMRMAGMGRADAYDAAYDIAPGTSRNVLNANAAKVEHNRKVQKWIRMGKREGLVRAAVTYENHLAELDRLKDEALDSGNIGAAVQAEHYRGKAGGLYIDRVMVDDQTNPLQVLDRIALKWPELAKQLAEKAGVVWPVDKGDKLTIDHRTGD